MADPSTGNTFLFYTGTELIGGQRGGSYVINTRSIDLSNKDTSGWDVKAAGRSSWSADVDGVVYSTNTGYLAIQTACLAQTAISVKVQDPNNRTKTGNAIVTSFSEAGPDEDANSFSISFEGTGALVSA